MENALGLSILNPRPRRLPGQALLHNLVRPACDDIALAYLSRGQITKLSYRALHCAADALAARISASCGSVDGQLIVPVLLQQCPDLYITLLAILKAGGAFCPLNLDAPSERIQFILGDVGAKAVVSSPELSAKIPQEAGVTVLYASDENEAAGKGHHPISRRILPESLAYVMYTSGSTGTPKGVSISHLAASQALLAHDAHIPTFSRFFQFAAPTFDVSVFEIFFPLFRGQTLVSARRQETLDDLPSVLRQLDVDACELTPTVAASLLRKRANAPKLKLLLTIGEMLNPLVVDEFGGSNEKASILWAMYGPTEATIHCTLQAEFQTSSSTGHIGRPLETVSCFIIKPATDEFDSMNFEILAIGQVGELAVGGEQLAVGYLNNEQKTNTAFIESPYGRVYRTGDEARMNKDGTLECLGRIADGQVKLRGQRIELGEIEHAILKTNGCHGVSVRVIGTTLVAFCAVDDSTTETDITKSCNKWLPQYMVPGEAVFMKELPRLPSGKVNTKELEQQFQQSRNRIIGHGDLGSEAEPELLQVLQSFFGSHLSTQTELVRAGLDSLTAISLASKLRQVGYEMTATSLLKMKNVGSILSAAIRVEEMPEDGNTTSSPTSQVVKQQDLGSEELELETMFRGIQEITPCTNLQVALLSETMRNAAAYWNTVDLDVRSHATAREILQALQTIVRQNEILRTGFVQHNSTFYSVIFDDINPNSITIVQPLGHTVTETATGTLLQPFRIYINATAEENLCRVRLHLHHAIYDGWSLDLFKSDLARAVKKGPVPKRTQFRDVVSFFASPKRKELDDQAKVFWADYLFGWNKPPFPRLSSKATKSVQIQTRTLTQAFHNAGDQAYTGSAQVPFQAALALVWAGILGLDDVVIGSVTSGRTIPIKGIDDVMGPCISSLPLRVKMESMATVDDLVNSIASSNRRMMEHVTLSQLEIKKLAKLYGREQLYDVLFVYQESLEQRKCFDSIVKEVAHHDHLETRLVLEVQPIQGAFVLQATFHDDNFPPQLVELLLRQIAHISSKIFDSPKESLYSVKSLLVDVSTYNLNLEKMHRSCDLDNLASIVELAATRYPDRPAVSFTSEISADIFAPITVSYRELNQNANRIAHFLLSLGVQTGNVIPIIMNKSIRLYTAILGIIKAGCGYLPLLPTTPHARVLEIFKQSESCLCLADEGSLRAIPPFDAIRTVLIDEQSIEEFPNSDPLVKLNSADPAYVIYTSGTTGTPKGVAVSQKNIASNVTYLGIEYPEAENGPSKLLQACSQAFDVSVFEIFFAWHKGMCLCAAPNDALFADIEETIRRFEITHLSLTPTIASLIDPHNVPTVGFLVTAGEPMTGAVHARWNRFLWQGYGPSETTNICSVKKMSENDYIEHLGLVFDNTSVVVLQPKGLATLPVGWAGELCFGGDQVANGYLNMPRLTAEKFIQHPTYGRIYRSGDLGRMLPDGSLVILGRIDDQLKLRGQRIEAAEVNGIVTRVASAAAAATLVLKQKDSISECLVTFYVGGDAEEAFRVLDPDKSLQEHVFAELQAQLLSYMVPSYLIPVSRIPLTASGKVDRKAISLAFSQLSRQYLQTVVHAISREDDKDWSDVEHLVASLIAVALHVSREDIGRWSPLAILGLDSISAIHVSKHLAKEFNTTLPISAILQQPTIAQLAKMLESSQQSNGEIRSRQYFDKPFLDSVTNLLAGEGKEVVQILPCSPLQEAMISRGKTSYYNKSLLRLRLDPYKMRSHWQHMCDRHSILRTCFVSTNNADYPIAQISLPKWELPWYEFTVTQPSLDDAMQQHLALVPEPLDTNLPPLSLALIRYRESAFLSFICHHALYDGVAMECLWREVETLARGEQLRPAIPYGPFIHEALSLPDDNQKFWKQQFMDFCPSLLFPRFDGNAMEPVMQTITVERSLRRAQDRIKSLGISLLSVCQATVSRILVIISQKSDICFGNVINGRTIGIEGIERLVAPCFNTVPIRQDLTNSVSNIDLARNLLALNTELLKHQFTPLRQVQKIAATETRSLFDTLLLVQQPLQEMDVGIWTLEEDAGAMDLPLVYEVTPCPGLNSLLLNVHYDMCEVPGELAMGIAELFKYVFLQILEFPHATMGRDSIPKSLLKEVQLRQLYFANDEVEQLDIVEDDFLWSKEELDIRTILSELSGVPAKRINHTTSLFKLGLDSINAVQVASRLRQKQYSASASDIVECQNCLQIAKRLLNNGHSSDGDSEQYDFASFETVVRPVIGKLSAAGRILPCTPMQCAMVSAFVSSQGVHYLNEIVLDMNKGISASLVMDKWADLIQAYPMLRTGFAPVRHTDCNYAMVQYQDFAIAQDLEIVSVEVEDNWKLGAAKDILANLHLPPWRLAICPKSDTVTIYLVIHHALYDATSLQHMLVSFGRLLTGNAPQPVEDILVGLSSVVRRSSERHEATCSFWRQMGQQATINRFPLLTPLRESARGILTEEMSSDLTVSNLHQLVRDLGISVQTAILASWTRLLACYTGEESVVFGVTLSGRTCERTLKTPIPCITTVPVVARNVGPNRELLNQMMTWASNMHQHQFLPLSRIQKEMGHPATAVFDTLVAYQKIADGVEKPPWTQTKDDAAIEFPVSLELEPSSDGMVRLRLTFFSDILPSEQARLLLRQFDAAMEDLLKNPDGHQNDLYKLRPGIFSITPPLEPNMDAPVQLLHQFVELQARLHPNKLALEHVSAFRDNQPIRRQWTFSQLDSIGNKVANMLSSRTEAGSIIAVHFDKCAEAYFAILGILKSGSAFVALDFNAPSARKEFILQDSHAPCLLTSHADAIDFDASCPIIVINEALLDEYPDTPCQINGAVSPNSTCYCLYTSGTTGTPKGCEITHENTVQCMMAFQELFRGHWADDSRWLQFAALHFDVSVLEQYWSWSVGIAVVAAKKDLILDDLIGFINNLDITHIDLTPSLARLTHPDTVPSLCRGVFITGGEQLKQEILDAWGSKAVIYNAYGPTEATIGVTTYQRVPRNGRPSNIGRQFRNVGSYVFHRDTEIPVLRGAVGELCVSGKLVGKGYLNRPELTMEKFPTLERFGERIYSTGDLVRILHDGCFEFLGRADDQVKLRGQRLELGEIDHVIRSLGGIHDVATVVTKHTSSGKDVLVSFIVESKMNEMPLHVLEDNSGMGAKARDICRDKLPGYMVPSYFVKLPYIPLSPNNKAEAKQLKKVFSEISQEDLVKLGSAAVKRNLDTHSPGFQKLLSLISEFCSLNQEVVSESASIFDFGVDSITTLQLSTFLAGNGFAAASPALLLRNPIIADLAVALSTTSPSLDTSAELRQIKQRVQACAHRHRARVCREFSISPSEIEYIYPCSPLQQGMLAKTAVDEDQGYYFNTFKLLLKPDASIPKLKDAIASLVAMEPILRTSFVHSSEGYIQFARRRPDLPWEEYMLTSTQHVQDFIPSVRQEWIALNRNDLRWPFKIALISSDGVQLVLLQLFHGLYDGTSFELMSKRIGCLYNGLEVHPGPAFPDALMHGPLINHDGAKQAWIEHLQCWAPAAMSLTAKERSAIPISATRVLGLSNAEQLRSRSNVTMHSVLLAAWVAVLQKYTAKDVTTGVIVSGRSINMPGVEDTIGPMFNTLPFFANISAAPTWALLLARCQNFNAMVHEDPHVPLQQIQKWASVGKPLFKSLFAFQTEDGKNATVDVPWVIEDGGLNPDYPLAFEVTKRLDNSMQLLIVAESEVTSVAELEQLLNDFVDMLESMATAVEVPVQIHPAVSESFERQSTDIAPRAADADFNWCRNSNTLRQEIATLANVAELEITPSTTWLELGLDSIDAVQLSARLKKQQLTLSPSAIMKGLSFGYMVNAVQHISGSGATVDGAAMQEVKPTLRSYVEVAEVDMSQVEDVLPTTPLQDSMVSGMLESGFTWYFNHEILEVASGVDVLKLQAAWVKLFEVTPILRTGFVQVSDPHNSAVYVQFVQKSSPEVPTVVLSSMDDIKGITAQNTTRAIEHAAKQGLAQVVCASIGEKTFFVLSISHALYDGWSLGLLHQDLRAIYEDQPVSRPSPDQFLIKSSASLASEAADFWANYLDGVQPTILPEVPLNTPTATRVEKTSGVRVEEIQNFCRSQKTSLQSLCQACWAIILAQRTGSLDVVFGAVLSGRDFEGAEDLMFPTMNTVAVRCILNGSISSFLRYMEDNLAELRLYQMYPLRRAKAAAKMAGKDLFNSLFLLQKSPASTDSQTLFKSVDGSASVDYPVCVEAAASGNQLEWTVACQNQMEQDQLAEDLIAELDTTLKYILRHAQEELVVFSHAGVEICGSNPVTLAEDHRSTLHIEADATLHEWNTFSVAIRKTLSQASNVPEQSIAASSTLYHLGLDSITAIKVSTLLKQQGIFLRPTELVRATSISQMAELAKRSHRSVVSPEGLNWQLWAEPTNINLDAILHQAGISRDQVEHILPALPMQVYMMSAWQNTNGKLFYPEFAYELSTSKSPADIHKAWRQATEKLPTLRTCLVATGQQDVPFIQVVLKPGVSSSDMQPFVRLDVRQGSNPMLKALRLRIHHALYDGISLPATMAFLLVILKGEASTAPVSIEPLAQMTASTQAQEQKDLRRTFWTKYLEGYRSVSADEGTSGPRTSIFEPAALSNTSSLASAASQCGFGLQSLVFAAYAVSIARDETAAGSSTSVVFGIYLANRSDEQIPDILPALNLVPLRAFVGGGRSLVQVAQQIHDDIRQITAEGSATNVGLWEVAQWTGVRVDRFVNFLTLPAAAAGDEAGLQEMHLTNLPSNDVANDSAGVLLHSALVANNAVRSSYPDSIDVEFAIRNGQLDIGVFGPRALITEREANELVHSIKNRLKDL